MKYLNYSASPHKSLDLSPRKSASKRGYNARWQAARLQYLMANPLCVDCQQQNRIVSAQVVDHITPHKGDMALFWDRNNWQGLCKSHHSQKTAKQDGGFGNHQPRPKRKTPTNTIIGKVNHDR